MESRKSLLLWRVLAALAVIAVTAFAVMAEDDPDPDSPAMREFRQVILGALRYHDEARKSVADALGRWQENCEARRR